MEEKANGDGVAMIRDEHGNTIVILDKNGVYALGQYVCDSKVFKNKRIKLNEGSMIFSGRMELIRLLWDTISILRKIVDV